MVVPLAELPHPVDVTVDSHGVRYASDDSLGAVVRPARPRPFAGLTTTANGSLLLAANGEGTLQLLTPHEQPRQPRT